MWDNVRRYAVAMTTGDVAKLLKRAREASAEVEKLEASLAAALEQRNAIFLEIASEGVSASRISEAVGGRVGTSGVRYGILKAQKR